MNIYQKELFMKRKLFAIVKNEDDSCQILLKRVHYQLQKMMTFEIDLDRLICQQTMTFIVNQRLFAYVSYR